MSPSTTRSRRATDLKSQIRSVYHSHCIEEVYPRCQCKFYKLHPCAHHKPDGSSPKPSEMPGHILRIEGQGMCDNCKAAQLEDCMLQEFFNGTLEVQIRKQKPQTPPKQCTLTGWRCTQCEQTKHFELKLCKAHDEENPSFRKRLRIGAQKPSVVSVLAGHLQADIGKQPSCVSCTSPKDLRRLVDRVARDHRVDVEFGYLPEETRVLWSKRPQ